MNKKVLFVSDLDGTLLRNDVTLSAYTVRTVNDLVRQGFAFTYATARSIESARPIAGKLQLALPVITRNGCVLADNNTGRHLEKAVFTEAEVRMLKELLPELPECGFVSCFLDDRMVKMHLPVRHTAEFQGYVDYYAKDPGMVRAENFDGLFCGKPGYVTMVGSRDYIAPIHERVRGYNGWECVFQRDTYRDEYWLEICPQNCTKAKTVLKLKKEYGFEKIIVFGDSVNDLPMFRIANEAYAVRNAAEEVKSAATAVIGSNEEDAVAKTIRRLAAGFAADSCRQH